MANVLLLNRLADAIGPAEKQAFASELGVSVEEVNLLPVPVDSCASHDTTLLAFGHTWVNAVALSNAKEADYTRHATKRGVPHYVFMPDRSRNGSCLGQRLHQLNADGTFTVCTPRKR